MILSERIRHIIDYKGISVRKFEQLLDCSNGVISKVLSKHTDITSSLMTKIIEANPTINADWLLTGAGEMLKQSTSTPSKITDTGEGVLLDGPVIMRIPLVPVYAYAGFLCGFGDQESLEHLPTIPMVATHQGKGNYIAIEVKGDSMDDQSYSAILPRDIIVCREIAPMYWQEEQTIHYRKWPAFLIVHKEEGIIVKQIIDHNTTTKKIIVHSLNREYPDQEISLADVHQLFNVVQIVRNLH